MCCSSLSPARQGYIISVLYIIDIGQGKIMASRGHVLFNVEYQCVMFRPMINEVLDVTVTQAIQVSMVFEANRMCHNRGSLRVF